jgi:predicted metal-dependent enzyme (double-stranded beta helix superfamily)
LPGRHDHYARRLIWREPDASFVVTALTWLPGQSSPLHDHAGLWGAEIVVAGTMSETGFRLLDRHSDGRYRFARESQRLATKGSLGILIPPLEYHDFGNHGSETAHTVHVYAGDLTACNAFTYDDDGWWKARHVDLRYDG